ncbi:hypothetical protein Bresa_01642|uniref:Uncharacterized protein n=1 Tax=Brenneria salicis ATCC 15712 = DSM 30166 TaxID=714314 RepID=A0A366I5C1_9GAMM|nr:hypothetical protein [Brenneria salicis ATCC 15712 = DSM 30166]RBP62688.1 hypothetical protein DES54_11525 [Brenneria salicis ATCC 15712 = DSM 30166]RLM30656.1 hypothetical protein BHG07_09440 [Brenneria salicis ATCC 15712 = DSM 30166]
MTDGGRRGDPTYRSAARHRAATPRKADEAKRNEQGSSVPHGHGRRDQTGPGPPKNPPVSFNASSDSLMQTEALVQRIGLHGT